MVIFHHLKDCPSPFALRATQPSQDAHSSMILPTKPQCSILEMIFSITFVHQVTNPSSTATLSIHIVSAKVRSLRHSGKYSSQ
jgi:hypothetical protein